MSYIPSFRRLKVAPVWGRDVEIQFYDALSGRVRERRTDERVTGVIVKRCRRQCMVARWRTATNRDRNPDVLTISQNLFRRSSGRQPRQSTASAKSQFWWSAGLLVTRPSGGVQTVVYSFILSFSQSFTQSIVSHNEIYSYTTQKEKNYKL